MMEYTGLFVYVKINGWENKWYNIVGYVSSENIQGDIETNKPLIDVNGTYYQLGFDNDGFISELLVPNEELVHTIITDLVYQTTVYNSAGVPTGRITNDYPITQNIKIKDQEDSSKVKINYQTYRIELFDEGTRTASRYDANIVNNGPSITLVDDDDKLNRKNDDGAIFNPEDLSILSVLPVEDSEIPGKYCISYFYPDVSINLNNIEELPIIYDLTSKLEVMTASELMLIDNQVYILFNSQISSSTSLGSYCLYIPSGLVTFLSGNNSGKNSQAIVVYYTVEEQVEVVELELRLQETSGEVLKTLNVLSNLNISSFNFGRNGISIQEKDNPESLIVLSANGGNTIKRDAESNTKFQIDLESPIYNTDEQDQIWEVLFKANSINLGGVANQEAITLSYTLKLATNIELQSVSITGKDKITKAGEYEYVIKGSPKGANISDVTLSIVEDIDSSILYLDGNKLIVTDKIEGLEFGITLHAESYSNPDIYYDKNVTIAYVEIGEDTVPLKQIIVTGPTYLSVPNYAYRYNATLKPSNTTQTTLVWELDPYPGVNLEYDDDKGYYYITLDDKPTVDHNLKLTVTNEESEVKGTLTIALAKPIPLSSISIIGDKKIHVGLSINYSLLCNPEDADTSGVSWETAKLVNGNNLPKEYSFSDGLLTIASYVENCLKVVISASDSKTSVRTSKTITVSQEEIIVPTINLSSIGISGPITISSVGSYKYTASFTPKDATNTDVLWNIYSGAYSGVTIDTNGNLEVEFLPVSDCALVIKCTSALNATIYNVCNVTILASLDEETESSTLSFNPKTPVVSSLSNILLLIKGVSDIKRIDDPSVVKLSTPRGIYTPTNSVLFKPIKINGSYYFEFYFGQTFTEPGKYIINVPAGFLSLDGVKSNEVSFTYRIKGEGSSDDSADLNGLLVFTQNTEKFRVLDSIIVAEENLCIPRIYLNPQVYYKKDGKTVLVTEGSVNLSYRYTDSEGLHIINKEGLPYGVTYNLTSNIFDAIDELRSIEMQVTIYFKGLSVSKHFDLIFVDPDTFYDIQANKSYYLLDSNFTASGDEVKNTYGCTKVTGYEVILLMQYEGEVYKLCDNFTVNKLRLGNLENIYDERFGKRQPHGYGLYSENVYLTGNFTLNNGKTMMDLSDDFTILRGDVARVEDLLDGTKQLLLTSYKETINNLNNTLNLIADLNSEAIHRLDAIGADGIISVDEKSALKADWLLCVDSFNTIQTRIYNLKNNIEDDKSYKDLQKANVNLVKAFYDLNHLITIFILNSVIWSLDIYDKAPTPEYDGITIEKYINNSVRRVSYVNVIYNSEVPDYSLVTETENTKVIIQDYTLKDAWGLNYVKDENLTNPIRLYPCKRTVINEGSEEYPVYKETYSAFNAGLDYYYSINLFTFKEILNHYYSLLTLVELLTNRCIALESLVEQFNTNGEKAADTAIRNFMGNLRDSAFYMGADYSLFAMGSAGIAITNPDLTYTIAGKTLASYIDDQLVKARDSMPTDVSVSEQEEILAKAARLGFVDYNIALQTSAPELIAPDYNTVGDGDEQLYLFGDKVKILTTDKVIIGEGVNKKVYLKITNFKCWPMDSVGSQVTLGSNVVPTGSTQSRGVSSTGGGSSSGKSSDSGSTDSGSTGSGSESSGESPVTPPEQQPEIIGDGGAYILQEDLRCLKGNYTDRMLSLADPSNPTGRLNVINDKNSSMTFLSVKYSDYGGKEVGAPYYISDGLGGLKQGGFLEIGSDVTIAYKLTALFADGYIAAELIKTGDLEVGYYDKDLVLITNDPDKPYVRVYREDHKDPKKQEVLPKGTLDVLGGALVLGNSKGNHVILGKVDNTNLNNTGGHNERVIKYELTDTTAYPGTYIYNDPTNLVAEFSGREDYNLNGLFSAELNYLYSTDISSELKTTHDDNYDPSNNVPIYSDKNTDFPKGMFKGSETIYHVKGGDYTGYYIRLDNINADSLLYKYVEAFANSQKNSALFTGSKYLHFVRRIGLVDNLNRAGRCKITFEIDRDLINYMSDDYYKKVNTRSITTTIYYVKDDKNIPSKYTIANNSALIKNDSYGSLDKDNEYLDMVKGLNNTKIIGTYTGDTISRFTYSDTIEGNETNTVLLLLVTTIRTETTIGALDYYSSGAVEIPENAEIWYCDYTLEDNPSTISDRYKIEAANDGLFIGEYEYKKCWVKLNFNGYSTIRSALDQTIANINKTNNAPFNPFYQKNLSYKISKSTNSDSKFDINVDTLKFKSSYLANGLLVGYNNDNKFCAYYSKKSEDVGMKISLRSRNIGIDLQDTWIKESNGAPIIFRAAWYVDGNSMPMFFPIAQGCIEFSKDTEGKLKSKELPGTFWAVPYKTKVRKHDIVKGEDDKDLSNWWSGELVIELPTLLLNPGNTFVTASVDYDVDKIGPNSGLCYASVLSIGDDAFKHEIVITSATDARRFLIPHRLFFRIEHAF